MQTLLASTGDVHAPSANTAAVVTYTGVSGQSHGITGISWSYDDDPTGGNLKVQVGSDVVFTTDITTKGAGVIYFTPNKTGAEGEDLVITLAAGGPAVVGKVSVLGHFQK